MDQKTESLKHADPWLTIPLLKKRITSHISVKPSCPSFDGYITATNNKYGKRYKQVSCRLWKSRTQRQIFQNTRQQEMLYLSEVTGIKETRSRQESNSFNILFRNYQTEKQEWINTFPVQSLQTQDSTKKSTKFVLTRQRRYSAYPSRKGKTGINRLAVGRAGESIRCVPAEGVRWWE